MRRMSDSRAAPGRYHGSTGPSFFICDPWFLHAVASGRASPAVNRRGSSKRQLQPLAAPSSSATGRAPPGAPPQDGPTTAFA